MITGFQQGVKTMILDKQELGQWSEQYVRLQRGNKKLTWEEYLHKAASHYETLTDYTFTRSEKDRLQVDFYRTLLAHLEESDNVELWQTVHDSPPALADYSSDSQASVVVAGALRTC